MKLKLVLFCVLVLSFFSLLFGESDQVFLKNGQIVTGVLQNYEIGKFVEIITLENRRQIINWDQIESLNLASGNTPATNQAEKINPDIKVDLDTKKGITFDQTLDSDQLRLNWERQGGLIQSTEVAMNYIFTKMEINKLSADSTESGKMKINGGGFGYTLNMNLLKFSPPNYALNKYTSYAAKLGFSVGVNANMFSTKYEESFADSIPGMYLSTTDISLKSDITIATIDLGLNLGFNYGLGHFLNPQKWGGVILGVAWRPSWQWTSTNTITTNNNWYITEIYVPYYQYYWDWDNHKDQTTKDQTQFSWSAVEFSLDFGGIKAMTDKMAKRAHFRLNFMYIPPVGDYKMTMMYLGMGMVWYK